jgi:NCS2 family nucleobase:cation symporter-2
MKNIGGGILADGLSAVTAGFVGTMGQSTSSSNIGLSIGTGATSRRIAFAAGGILVSLAFFPKLAAIFVIMPTPVMGATLIYAVSFMIVTGFRIIMSRMLDVRKTFVVGIPLIFGLSVDVLPGLYDTVHPWIHPIFSSSLSLATILAITLNVILRIGIAQRQRLVLRPGVDTSDTIFAFMEKQGAAWGARREVIYHAIAALTEFYESVSLLKLARSDITVEVSFDEFNLDMDIQYEGTPMEFPAERPTEGELISDTRTTVKLSGFMIMNYVDRLRTELKGDLCRVRFHFDH